MVDTSSQVESAPIASIKSLKSRFEQFALDNASASSNVHPKPTLPIPIPSSSHSVLVSESTHTPRSRTQLSLTPDDLFSQSQLDAPVCDVRSKVSNPDLKAAALKRVPPPPPPPRSKKPPASPLTSPLLRPVPVPPTLRSPRTSPKCESLAWPDYRRNAADESSEEGSLSSVGSFRNRFS